MLIKRTGINIKSRFEDLGPDETLIHIGDPIKAVKQDDGKVLLGGYLVRFGSPDETDLSGDFFTPETDFGDLKSSEVYFHHRYPLASGEYTIPAYRKTLGKAELKLDEVGIFAEVVIQMRNEYEKMIADLGLKKKLGWSSGTAYHLVDYEHVANSEDEDDALNWGSWKITKWPLGLDASLTPTPNEYRDTNSVIPLKAFMSDKNTSRKTTDPEVAGEIVDETMPADKDPIPVKSTQTRSNTMFKTKQEALEHFAKLVSVKVADLNDDQIRYALKGTKWEIEDLVVEPSFSLEDVGEIVKTAVTEAVKAVAESAPPVDPGSGITVVTDEGDQPWETDGEFFLAVKSAALSPHNVDPRLLAVKAGAGMEEADPAQGGFLVTTTVDGTLKEKMWSIGEILNRVDPYPLGPTSNSMSFNTVDETSRAAGSRWGGIRGYWVAEGSSITNSQPSFSQIDLKLKKVAALAYATDELLMDTTTLAAWLQRTVADELKFMVEDAIYEGDGVGKPLGIMNSGCLISVTRINASTITPRDISNMYSRRWGGAGNYVWFANQDIHPVLESMTLTNEVYMPPGGFADAPFARLKGLPVIDIEYAATLGTTGDLMLASMDQYLAIDKGAVKGSESIHVRFETDEMTYKFTYRIDGQPAWRTAVTPFKGSNTQSPFVVMSTSS